jgi:hypothetical protein
VRNIVAHFVAAVMTLHALLGCCVHHAHTGSDCAHPVVAAEVEHEEHSHKADSQDRHSHEHHCCGHQHTAEPVAPSAEASHDDEHPAPAPCSGSCEGQCRFTTTSRVQWESPAATLDIRYCSLTADVVAPLSPLVRIEIRRTTVPPLPIRLHLWNRLLLI